MVGKLQQELIEPRVKLESAPGRAQKRSWRC